MPTRHACLPALLAIAAATLTACGGGGGGAESSVGAQLTGTAATGGALAQATVSILNAAGQSPCVETAIVTSGTGSFGCTLKPGEVAPFFVSVTDPAGVVRPLVSVATSTPAPGAPLVVNATPLTTAIVAQLASDGDALSVFKSQRVDSSALAQLTSNVLAQLEPVLGSINAPAGYNPFSTHITAASNAGAGNTADLVLDVVKVGTDAAGRPTLGTADNPAGVTMATATSRASALPAPSSAVAALSGAARAMALAFEQCFGLPVSQRVLSSNAGMAASEGGASVTSMHARCSGLADAGFLHNGYRFGQLYYGLLTSEAMSGARFNVPEVMQFTAAASSRNGLDTAIINLRYLDAAGQPGNSINVAVNKGSAQAPNWVLLGNQAPVDVAVRSAVQRVQYVGPAKANNTGVAGQFLSGIEVFVRKDGPGSSGLTAARVTGPGLPGAGLVLNRPLAAYEAQQSWMNIVDKVGTDPALVATRRVAAGGDIFWLARTQDLAGAGATTLADNPNANSGLNLSAQWAHPLDYGALPGQSADQYVPFGSLTAGASYKVELFYDGSATPRHTFYKSLLSPVIPATRGVALAWNAPGADLLAILDVSGGTLTGAASYSFSWTQNPAAEQVASTQLFSASNGVTVNQGVPSPVARGVTTSAATAPDGGVFATLDATARTSRSIAFNYRSFDGSLKRASFASNF